MSFDILSTPPVFDTTGFLSLETLTPLSLVDQMPGKFYRSQHTPSVLKLLGLIENALGWYLSEADRKTAIKDLCKRHKIQEPVLASGIGFISLLQYHVRVTETPLSLGGGITWNDLWSQHLRTDGLEFVGGSRNFDRSLLNLMGLKAQKSADIDEGANSLRKDIDFDNISLGSKIHLTAVRSKFPRYYSTPTPREYIEPSWEYIFRVETSEILAQEISKALIEPCAPLYLGSNDGWIEARWKTITESGNEVETS
jgi:CRISPR-associated protein Cas5